MHDLPEMQNYKAAAENVFSLRKLISPAISSLTLPTCLEVLGQGADVCVWGGSAEFWEQNPHVKWPSCMKTDY